MGLLKGKKALIFGIANDKSIAYGIAKRLKEEGAELAFSYASEVLAKRVKPIAENLGVKFCEECDVTSDDAIKSLFKKVEKDFGKFDILVHSVAYAPKEALNGRYSDTTRADFLLTMDISVYSFVAISSAAEKLMNDGGSIITMTYYGGEKVIPNYNVMGVAKAALDASVKYLAHDLGPKKGIRVNAISAGPIRTLAASGVSGFRHIFNVISQSAPLRHPIDIDDCGSTATYLASDLSKNVTGEILHVDSGFNTIGLALFGLVKEEH